MKKILLAAGMAAATLGATTGQAALIASESFDYTNTATLAGNNGGSGWGSASWASVSGVSSFVIGSPGSPPAGLSYTGVTSSGNSVVDNSTSSSTGTRANTRAWDTAGYVDSGDTLWFSILIRKGSQASGSDVKVGILSGSDPNTEVIGFRASANSASSGSLSAYVGSTASTSSLTFNTDTHLVVGKISLMDIAGGDTITIWLDPGSESATTSGGVSLSGDFNVGSNVSIRGGGTWSGWLDELRIGETFSDVAPVPEPAALGLLALGGLLALNRRRK